MALTTQNILGHGSTVTPTTVLARSHSYHQTKQRFQKIDLLAPIMFLVTFLSLLSPYYLAKFGRIQ